MWFILLCCSLIFLVFLAYLDTKKPRNYPPGPQWFPFIGCTLQLRKLHKSCGTLSKASCELSRRYGPLVGLRVGTKRVVLINGSEAMGELFNRNDLNGRPNDVTAVSRTWGKRLGIVFNDSADLKTQKSYLMQQLKNRGYRKQDLSDNLENALRLMIGQIKESIAKDNVICVDKFVSAYVAKTNWFLISGGKITLTDIELQEFIGAMNDFSKKISLVGDLFNYLPFLVQICPDFCGFNTYVNIHARITTFIKNKLSTYKESYNKSTCHSYIDKYLDMLGNPERRTSFSEDQLVAICLDMSIGGYETILHTTKTAISYLLTHPHVKKEAQEEIDRVVGRDRLPNMTDKQRLPYVNCVVLETLRNFMGRSICLPRRTTRNTTFNGYSIPKDTLLIGNFYSSYIDSREVWENSMEFIPERFMKNGHVVFPEEFIPFGKGRRKCPGAIIGNCSLFLIIATILHQFNLEIVPDNPPSMDFEEGFVPNVKPFETIVSLR